MLREENRQLIRERATLIWLDTSFDIILSELGNADRPLLHGRTPAQIRDLYEARRPLYAAAADYVFPITSTDYVQVIIDLASFIKDLDFQHA